MIRTPAPHVISRLLAQAGYTRSDPATATTGYAVFKIFHSGTIPWAGTPYVAVQHVVKGMHGIRSDAEWAAYRAEARRRLGEYAAVIRGRGFTVQLRDRHPEIPQLAVVTRGRPG